LSAIDGLIAFRGTWPSTGRLPGQPAGDPAPGRGQRRPGAAGAGAQSAGRV